jgi:predicted transcriptional regulator
MAVRASIERGLTDANAGNIVPVEEVMKEFGITE